MLLLIAAIALGFTLLYFLKQRQTHDDMWQNVRDRQRARRKRAVPEEEINPAFQFDLPPSDETSQPTGP